ncbi:hypothetical protein B0H10DRAFT_1780575 [Mycena sp. CBHHK59/15]|nr:hypothetical protein B0H10DRAFT_1780575 [Mycena sp. CBHHK59/15]
MHQAHNISCSLSSHLVFIDIEFQDRYRRIDLVPHCLPTQVNFLNHFPRTLAKTTREFSDTERAKYPARYDAQSSIPSNRSCSESFTPENLLIENWIKRAGPPATSSYDGMNDGGLADVAKVLMAENEMGQLLMLVQHPQIPIKKLLHSVYWGHCSVYDFGWDRVQVYALQAYIFLNVVLSNPDLQCAGCRYKSIHSYWKLICTMTGHAFVSLSFLGSHTIRKMGKICSAMWGCEAP